MTLKGNGKEKENVFRFTLSSGLRPQIVAIAANVGSWPIF